MILNADGTTFQTSQFDLLADLDTRHDELLLRLEELDKTLQKTLAECQTARAALDGFTPPG